MLENIPLNHKVFGILKKAALIAGIALGVFILCLLAIRCIRGRRYQWDATQIVPIKQKILDQLIEKRLNYEQAASAKLWIAIIQGEEHRIFDHIIPHIEDDFDEEQVTTWINQQFDTIQREWEFNENPQLTLICGVITKDREQQDKFSMFYQEVDTSKRILLMVNNTNENLTNINAEGVHLRFNQLLGQERIQHINEQGEFI